MADTDYTVIFHGHPKNISGNLFDVMSPFGRVVAVSVGNAMEDADRFRAALEQIVERGDGSSSSIAEEALEDADRALRQALETGRP